MEFQYLEDLAALNKDGGDHVRFLRVHTPSSRPHESMLYELRTFSLREAPRYTALSYCRQPEDRIVSIDVYGQAKTRFLVPHDLESAMRAMCRFHQNDWFWVDAVCINQSDDREKNDQVPRMRDIYGKAHMGFIWLGNAIPWNEKDLIGTGKDAEYQKYLIKKMQEQGVTGYEAAPDPEGDDFLRGQGLTRGKILQLSELSKNRRSWWCRTWVIQEMVLPAQLYVAIGLHVTPWDLFLEASYVWTWYRIPEPDDGLMRASARRLSALNELREKWHNAQDSLDLWKLLEIARESTATDEKDNVYGILGLVRAEDRQGIRVDYGRRTAQVYSEMTLMLIRKINNLDLVVNLSWHKSERSQTCLPSWVVDYTAGPYGLDIRFGHQSMSAHRRIETYGYKAGTAAEPSASIDETLLKLQIEAVVLDRVVEVVSSEERRLFDTSMQLALAAIRAREPRQIPSWISSAIELLQRSLLRQPPQDARHILQRMSDTVRILADPRNWNDDGSYPWVPDHLKTESTITLDDLWVEVGGLDNNVEGVGMSDFNKMYLDHCFEYSIWRSKVLFATEHGFVGWAGFDLCQSFPGDGPRDHSVHEGDIIVVPKGASTPWVLRKADADGEFRLVTDCTVHGVMKGELMSLVESQQLRTEKFTLV